MYSTGFLGAIQDWGEHIVPTPITQDWLYDRNLKFGSNLIRREVKIMLNKKWLPCFPDDVFTRWKLESIEKNFEQLYLLNEKKVAIGKLTKFEKNDLVSDLWWCAINPLSARPLLGFRFFVCLNSNFATGFMTIDWI